MQHGNTLRSLFTFLIFCGVLAPAALLAQRPLSVEFPKLPQSWQSGVAKMECNDAGEVDQFSGFQMQSNSFGDNPLPTDVVTFNARPDTIFLCAQDQFRVSHVNNSEDLGGDPVAGTTPGVGYAFYRCPPTVHGPSIQEIAADPCVADNGLSPFDTLAVAVPTNFQSGDYTITVANDGTETNTIPALFPVGGQPSPVVLTLAPITFDRVNNVTGQATYEGVNGPAGQCVNVSTDQSFAVAYLNPITVANLGIDPMGSDCNGIFDVRGGTPELLGGIGYSIRIVNTANGRTATITTPAADIVHDAVVRYQVPEAGTYQIIIEDENSCPLEMTTITHTDGCSLPVVFDFPFVTGENGQTVCLDITAENFSDIVGFQFEVAFDPAVAQFTGLMNQHPDFSTPIIFNGPPSSGGTRPDGSIRLTWNDFSVPPSPLNIASNQVLFSLCFEIIGMEGDQTGIDFTTDPGGLPPEFTRSDNVTDDALSNAGSISVTTKAFLLELTRTNEVCLDSGDGRITATASGAPDPYTFSIRRIDTEPMFGGDVVRNGNPATTDFNGLVVAEYAVRAIADNGDIVIDTIMLEEGLNIRVNVVEDERPSCNGFMDGSVRAAVSVGGVDVVDPVSLGYTFVWANSTETSDILSNLGTGTYAVTVTAPNGCTSDDSGNLGQPAAVNVRPDNPADAVSSATCSGAPDGSIQVTADGGTGPYEFDWGGTLGMDNDPMTSERMNLLPGEYAVIVTDSRGCADTANFVVDALKALAIVSEVDSITCFGDADGAIRVNGTATGAAPVGNYFVRLITLANGNVGPEQEITDNSTPFEFANLDEGRYVIVLRDNDPAGCETTDTFDIFEPALLEIDDDLTITNETCTVGMDGTVMATITGGTEPYVYRWVNDSLDTPMDTLTPGPALTGLSADTNYVLIVTDNNGCADTASFRILAPAGAQIMPIDTVLISCPGDNDGRLTVNAIPPQGETITLIRWYRLNADNTLGDPVANGATTNADLPVGRYAVEIITSNSCTAFGEGVVVSPGEVSLRRFVLNNPQCPGDANGSIFLEPTGGTPNSNGTYNYVWSTDPNGMPVTNPTRLNLVAGTYSVTITDGNDCQPPFDTTFILTDPPAITGNFAITDISCPDDVTMDGSATFIAEYSDGNAGTFDFLWTSGTADFNTTTSTESGLGRGPVTVRVTDGVCTESFTDTVRSPEEFVVALERDEVSCNGLSDGGATVTVTGGTGTYTYAWSADPTEMTNVLTDVPAGAYQLDITDQNGCSPATTDFVISQPDPLTLALDPVQTTETVRCAGDANGRIGVFISSVNNNDLPDNPYTWSGNIAPADQSLARDLQPGTYGVTVTDVEGCQDSLTYTIGEPEAITFTVLPIEEPLCFGETTPVLIDTAFGGTSNGIQDFTFSVNNDGFRIPVGQTGSAFAGEIVVTVFDSVGCSADQTFSVNQPPQILIDLPEEIVIELGDSLTQLNPLVSPAGDVYQYLWTPPTYLSSDTVRNPTIFPFESEDYVFRVTNANGCQAFADIFVEVDANRNVYIPNAFSPNRDGRNEDFRMFACQGVRAVRSVQIFDRWGGGILTAADFDPNCLDGIKLWDGKGKNGKPVTPGVFVYVIEVEFLDETRLTYRGDITVVK